MNNLSVKKIYCRHRLEAGGFCNTVVATTNGDQLFFEGEPIRNNLRFVGFECPRCHQIVKWRRSTKDEKVKS